MNSDYYLTLTMDMDGMVITHDLKFILGNPNLFFELLESKLLKASSENPNLKNLIIRHTHEVFNLKKLKDVVDLYGDLLIKTINKFSFKKIIFLDNNLVDFRLKVGIFHEGYPFFLGMTQMHSLKPQRQGFKKNFICFNQRETPHRKNIIRFLYNSNISNKTILTHGFEIDDIDKKEIDLQPSEDSMYQYPWVQHSYKPLKFNHISFCNIVTETFFYEKEINFITEKTERCFSSCQPFVMVAPAGHLELLRNYGYKTFNKWWDESYDTETDDEKRLLKIKKLIRHISNFSNEDMVRIYKEMTPILRHNNYINKNWFIKNIKYAI